MGFFRSEVSSGTTNLYQYCLHVASNKTSFELSVYLWVVRTTSVLDLCRLGPIQLDEHRYSGKPELSAKICRGLMFIFYYISRGEERQCVTIVQVRDPNSNSLNLNASVSGLCIVIWLEPFAVRRSCK